MRLLNPLRFRIIHLQYLSALIIFCSMCYLSIGQNNSSGYSDDFSISEFVIQQNQVALSAMEARASNNNLTSIISRWIDETDTFVFVVIFVLSIFMAISLINFVRVNRKLMEVNKKLNNQPYGFWKDKNSKVKLKGFSFIKSILSLLGDDKLISSEDHNFQSLFTTSKDLNKSAFSSKKKSDPME